MPTNSFADRLNELIYYYRLNKNSLSLKLGFTANSSITRLANHPERNPSFEMIGSILSAFPEISARWLVLGEGKMLEEDEVIARTQWISYYELDSLGALNSDNKPEPSDYMRVSGFVDCDIATDCLGDSMTPKIKSGDIILCKSAENKPIIFGEPYLIMASEPIIRYIKGAPNNDVYKVGTENPRIDDYEINRSEIICIYRIKGIIRRESA